MKYRFRLLWSLLLFPLIGHAQQPLTVGVAGSPPFVMEPGERTAGISIEIWEDVAEQLGQTYTYQYYDDVPQALAALQKGALDVLVGPTTITAERAENVQFSQPYYQSSLSIFSPDRQLSLWDRIKPFFSLRLLYAVMLFLCILAAVGTLLWLAERKQSPEQFPMQPAKGIGNGMWCAIVTMTTTGYGDLAPVTLAGRIITSAWMIISILFATSMVAGIASTLTLTGIGGQSIRTAEDMAKKRIAIVEGSPAEDLVRQYKGIGVPIHNIDEGHALLRNGQAEALVFDRPQLQYYQQEHPGISGSVSSGEYVRQGYGFAFPLDSHLPHDVNVAILHLKENGIIPLTLERWLGKEKP